VQICDVQPGYVQARFAFLPHAGLIPKVRLQGLGAQQQRLLCFVITSRVIDESMGHAEVFLVLNRHGRCPWYFLVVDGRQTRTPDAHTVPRRHVLPPAETSALE
jgi:hypothetical protein